MSKKYNLGSNSDMRKFQKDLKSGILQKAEQSLHQRQYEVDCPHCNAKIMAYPGKQPCPNCSKEIDLDLNINFNS